MTDYERVFFWAVCFVVGYAFGPIVSGWWSMRRKGKR